MSLTQAFHLLINPGWALWIPRGIDICPSLDEALPHLSSVKFQIPHSHLKAEPWSLFKIWMGAQLQVHFIFFLGFPAKFHLLTLPKKSTYRNVFSCDGVTTLLNCSWIKISVVILMEAGGFAIAELYSCGSWRVKIFFTFMRSVKLTRLGAYLD